MVASGSTVQYLFGRYYYILTNHNGVSIFPTLWIVTGCFLLVVSIFGILVSSGESTVLINTVNGNTFDWAECRCYIIDHYNIPVCNITVYGGSSACVDSYSRINAWSLSFERNCFGYPNSFHALVRLWHGVKRNNGLDAIKSKNIFVFPLINPVVIIVFHQYHCCGNNGPDDWINYSKSVEGPEILATAEDENATSTASHLIESLNAMPVSCCIRDSEYKNFRCDKYYTNGCFTSVQEIISANVMVASFSALGMALFDVGGWNIYFAAINLNFNFSCWEQ